MNRIMIMTQSQIDKLIAENVEKAVHEQKENDEYDLLKKQTDLAILANQINPHFLYNTLECICSMALINGDRSVADITLALSQYFRYSISGREGIVTLREELDNLKNYISIQQFRFPKKFKIHFGPMESLQEIGIPKLSLQQLVENAIIHGLKLSLIHISCGQQRGVRQQLPVSGAGGETTVLPAGAPEYHERGDAEAYHHLHRSRHYHCPVEGVPGHCLLYTSRCV